MLGRRIVGPREVVFGWDPAVDTQNSDTIAYQDALFDFSSGHIKISPGQKPTVWRLGPLTEAQKRQAKSFDQSSPEWSDFVFRCGCHGISNYTIEENGSEREVSQPDRKDRPGLGEMASVEWLQSSRIAMSDIESAAMIIWILSEARPPLSRP